MAPVWPLGTTSKSLFFITISTVWISWAPPGFSCPYFINYMTITVFIDIIKPNEFLNSMIFSFFHDFIETISNIAIESYFEVLNTLGGKKFHNYSAFSCVDCSK